ncbi:MAG: PKD domain-containing protein [Phycisphaerae bacterium]|nr:PKD domain-containing protein [Phycisphaerae bacterium]
MRVMIAGVLFSMCLGQTCYQPGSPLGAPVLPPDGPIADADEDQIAELGGIVTLDALASYDPAGGLLHYVWTQLSGPPVVLNDAESPRPTFLATEAGVYEFLLTVIDSSGRTREDVVRITVGEDEGNGAEPGVTASAGLDQVAYEGDTVHLVGDVRSNNGSELSCRWAQFEGPPVELTGAANAAATFVAPSVDADTVLSFSLTASDGIKTSMDTVAVVVLNAAEAASADLAMTIVATPAEADALEMITFEAKAIGGGALPAGVYRWNFGDGQMAEGKTAAHAFSASGTYVVSLCVTMGVGFAANVSCTEKPVTIRAAVGPGGGGPSSPPSNFQPVVDSQSASTLQGVPRLLTLQGMPLPLTFVVMSLPESGTLTDVGNAHVISLADVQSSTGYVLVNGGNQLLYTPDPIGTFEFTFKGHDGVAESIPATVSIDVVATGELEVTPAGGLSSSGSVGGPFSPTSQAYTLSNTGSQALNWTAARTQSWVTLSATSGSLAAGASTTVTVSINSGANSLAAGSHNDTVTFTNTTNGSGNTTRTVALTVQSEVGDLQAPFATHGVTANGLIAPDEWSDAQVFTMNALNTVPPGVMTIGSTASLEDTSATVYLKHDDDYLYIAVAVTDDFVVPTAANIWEADVVELFLDHDNSATPNVGFNRMQFLVNAGGQTGSGGANPANSWIGAAALTSDGYSTEFRISKAAYGLTTGTYGFDIAISDVEPAAGSIETRYWYFATAEAATNESLWGTIVLAPGAGAFSVSAAGGLSSYGNEGGPFEPQSITYTLTNTGGEPINWAAAKTQSWVSLSNAGGVLEAGASDTVQVSINGGANSLAVGSHSDTVTFTNTTNGDGTTTRAVSLNVTSANTAPAVNAGPDQAIMLPTISVNLVGAVTDDGLPDSPGAVALTWSKVSGPGTVAFSSTTSVNPTATFSEAGTYVLRLTATDGSLTSHDEMTVYVLPVITAQADPSSGTAPLVVQFTAMEGGSPASTVPADATFDWDLGDGTMATGAQVSHTYTSGGTFVAALTLTLAGGLGSFNCAPATTDVTPGGGATSGVLTVSPAGDLTSMGHEGGPFSPPSITYTLTNTGGESLNWTAARTQPWVSLSKTGGTLAVDASDTVEVSINSTANGLAADSYSDTVTFTTNADGGTTRAVDLTVLFPAMTTASRTSGVAPLGVFFDAVDEANPAWTSGVVQPGDGDYASYHYEWDFGNPDSGNWSTGRKNPDGSYPSKNTATNYLAAHVYETPGTYAVTLTVTDTDGVKHRYAQVITVSAFSGTTYYVSSSEGNDANPGTSEQAPLRTFAAAMTKLATNTRILFKRGDSWSTQTGASLAGIPGPGIIGAYGDGNRPVIQLTVADAILVNIAGQPDWRIMDLYVRGAGTPGRGIENHGHHGLTLRCYVTNFRNGIHNTGYGCGVLSVENELVDNTNYCAFTGSESSRRSGFLGIDFDTSGEHLIRTHVSKLLISHCAFQDTPVHAIKACPASDGSRYIVISDNWFWPNTGQWIVSVGAQDNRPVAGVPYEQVVIERNIWVATGGIAVQSRGADHVTVRNNLARGPDYLVAFGDGVPGFSTWTNWQVYNNTISNPLSFGRLVSGESAVNLSVKNNIIYTPTDVHDTYLVNLTGTSASAAEVTSDNNCIYAPNRSGGTLIRVADSYYTLAQWQALGNDENSTTNDPLFVNAAGHDLRLQALSPCVDGGVDLPWVRSDYGAGMRPQNIRTDMGALEYPAGN